MTGVDDMSTQDIFGYFKEYPPAHIEWIDDASCKCVTQTQTHAHSRYQPHSSVSSARGHVEGIGSLPLINS